MALTVEEQKAIDRQLAAVKKICKTLAPLTIRGQRRILVYMQDLVTDPMEEGSLSEVEILKDVSRLLGH